MQVMGMRYEEEYKDNCFPSSNSLIEFSFAYSG